MYGLMSAGEKLKFYTFRKTGFDSNTTKSVSIDVTSIRNYKKLTVDNFFISEIGINPKSTLQAAKITRSYNADSGILTVSLSVSTTYVSLWSVVEVICVTTG